MLVFLLYAAGMIAQPDWGYNPNKYESEHVVYAGLVNDNGGAVGEDGSYIGAFIDGECRGWVQLASSNGIVYYPLRVKGSADDNGKTITFRHQTQSGLEYNLTPTQTLTYADNATTGTLSALYTLKFVKPDSYQILQPNISVKVGGSVDLMQHLKFFPEGADIPTNISWDFANNRDYYVVENNQLKGKKAKNDGWLGFYLSDMKSIDDVNSFNVNVIQPATSITILDEYKDGITVSLNSTEELTNALKNCYAVQPDDCNEELTWTSSDETAIKPVEGVQNSFQPVKTGTYTMTLKGENASAELRVTVIKPVTSIDRVGSNDDVHVFVGDDLSAILPFGFKVLPEDATDKRVEYYVINGNYGAALETNEEDGKVVAVAPGTAEVRVISLQNPQMATMFNVVVHKKVNGLSVKQKEMSVIMPVKETDQSDFSKEILDNIVFDPAWPVFVDYDKYTTVSLSSSETGVLNMNYNFYNTQDFKAIAQAIGETTVSVKFNTIHTKGTDNGLVNEQVAFSESFKVNVVEGLKGFNVEPVLTGLGDYTTVKITPDPVNAKYDPELIDVTVNWNPQYSTELTDWRIAEISTTDDARLNWVLTPKALGHGIITVNYAKEAKGTGELTVGQSYLQKAGWVWSTFYENIESGTMQELFGDALEEVRSEEELMYNDPQYGYFGTLSMLYQETFYKVKIAEDPGYVEFTIGANGYSALGQEKEYHTGWNWMPYNSQISLSPDEYFFETTFTDGDRIVSKDEGFAEYNGGKWVGSLTTMRFGQGYMFYNASGENLLVTNKGDKSFSQPTANRIAKRAFHENSVWTYNSAPFANNMTVVADLGARYSTDNYTVGAFVGDECRGEGFMIDGKCFITIHGNKGDNISFRLHDNIGGETRDINEQLMFANMAGSMKRPVGMTVGGATAIAPSATDRSGIAVAGGQLSIQGIDVASTTIVNMSGAVVLRNQTDISSLPAGVYVVKVKTKSGKTITKKFTI